MRSPSRVVTPTKANDRQLVGWIVGTVVAVAIVIAVIMANATSDPAVPAQEDPFVYDLGPPPEYEVDLGAIQSEVSCENAGGVWIDDPDTFLSFDGDCVG